MTKGEDGQHYFNYVSWRSVVETTGMDDDDYPLYLRDIGGSYVILLNGRCRFRA
jgi:hypothetical protein